MAGREPQSTNLNIYGDAELPWSRAHRQLGECLKSSATPVYLGTVRPDGRPHSAGIGALWLDDEMYFVSGPGTRKSRNLGVNPACTISVRLTDLDLVLEGEAERVTEKETLEKAAAAYRNDGWPVEADGDAFTAPYSAPSAGPPPWHLYRFVLRTAFGVATAEPHGATRWSFGR